jgi:hypothetical protein
MRRSRQGGSGCERLMSTGFELIPLAIAATVIAALKRRKTADNAPVWSVEMPIRDESLLAETLAALGTDRGRSGELRYGIVDAQAIAFSFSPAGHVVAHVDGSLAEPAALRLVHAIDAEYRRQVQQRVLTNVLQRAPQLDLQATVLREEPDGTVVVQLQTPRPGQIVELGLTSGGLITGQTHGIKGDSCLFYGQLMEELADAQTVRSWYTREYSERDTGSSYHARTSESQLEQGC